MNVYSFCNLLRNSRVENDKILKYFTFDYWGSVVFDLKIRFTRSLTISSRNRLPYNLMSCPFSVSSPFVFFSYHSRAHLRRNNPPTFCPALVYVVYYHCVLFQVLRNYKIYMSKLIIN